MYSVYSVYGVYGVCMVYVWCMYGAPCLGSIGSPFGCTPLGAAAAAAAGPFLALLCEGVLVASSIHRMTRTGGSDGLIGAGADTDAGAGVGPGMEAVR